ncbi:MAG: hypothetical protein PHQ23_07560 [Candidatus Wallbacteria bacterium]|nr:hypothetical protein [Candidatus Wallbacteria bacterium]
MNHQFYLSLFLLIIFSSALFSDDFEDVDAASEQLSGAVQKLTEALGSDTGIDSIKDISTESGLDLKNDLLKSAGAAAEDGINNAVKAVDLAKDLTTSATDMAGISQNMFSDVKNIATYTGDFRNFLNSTISETKGILEITARITDLSGQMEGKDPSQVTALAAEIIKLTGQISGSAGNISRGGTATSDLLQQKMIPLLRSVFDSTKKINDAASKMTQAAAEGK